MIEAGPSLSHSLPSGLCEDQGGEATALIRRMAKGDGAALAELHGMWAPVLAGIACRMLGERRDADEVLRQTFERLWKQAAGYDAHLSPPFVWAFVTLRGLAMEHLLRRRRGRREAAASPSVRGDNLRVLPADDYRRLRAAMDQLDLEERTCLELAVFLGYARVGNPDSSAAQPATVKNHLRRALETVRNHLSRHEL
jgi:RNA polymerase sigma-70 factor (ECF subfamily)